MSKLTDLGFQTEDVVIRPAKGEKPAVTVTVRGLSGDDAVKLVRVHMSAIQAMIAATQAPKEDVLSSNQLLVGMLFQTAPDMVADIIAYASGEEGEDSLKAFDIAKSLPFPAQVRLLEKIAELTFVDQTPGEFVETVIGLMGGFRGLLTNLSASKAGAKG